MKYEIKVTQINDDGSREPFFFDADAAAFDRDALCFANFFFVEVCSVSSVTGSGVAWSFFAVDFFLVVFLTAASVFSGVTAT